MSRLLLPLLCIPLVACTPEPAPIGTEISEETAPTASVFDQPDQSCLDDTERGLVGQSVSVVSELGISSPDGIRILRPNDLFTEDYRPNRINIGLDRNDVVAQVWCG
ncbi:I78 family peptidase inhibitor [Cochlodiniinecator piscidefendens]|uniref:I78 family peptidase inhibitor n=1 Tax=Cochlodiniinecator piscidefendens TaxID=2715756 RepID=UPI001409AB3D|nr:I78 family peptidase inhibitor [Cochlodiniinecator piscidefendens]